MNKKQQCALIVGLLLMFLAGLFPPVLSVMVRILDDNRYVANDYHVANGRTFLAHPEALRPLDRAVGVLGGHGYNRIDYWRLVVEWITIGSLAAGLFLVFKPQQRRVQDR